MYVLFRCVKNMDILIKILIFSKLNFLYVGKFVCLWSGNVNKNLR